MIICTVALFDSIREWNRQNIDGYIEVFIDTPYEVLRHRNKKGLYTKDANENDLICNSEFPQNPDVIIGGGEEPVYDCVDRIMTIVQSSGSEYDRDRDYWNSIYQMKSIDFSPSDFAKFVLDDMMQRGGHDAGVFDTEENGVNALISRDSAVIRQRTEPNMRVTVLFVCSENDRAVHTITLL